MKALIKIRLLIHPHFRNDPKFVLHGIWGITDSIDMFFKNPVW